MRAWTRWELHTQEDGRVRGRCLTNDDDGDGIPDGEVTSTLMEWEDLATALSDTGSSRRGDHGERVTVVLDGELVESVPHVIAGGLT